MAYNRWQISEVQAKLSKFGRRHETRHVLLAEVVYSLSKDIYYPINYLIHLFGFKMTNSIEDDVSICCKYAV